MPRVHYAVTRAVSPAITQCELTYIKRAPIDYATAVRQHDQYVALLRSFGLEVSVLPAAERFPDCCFVEDTAVVFDQVAVITRMGSESRRGEEAEIEAALAPRRPLVRIEAPATLDGGDVLCLGRTVYVGLSGRTNEAGVAALRELLAGYDYRIESVPVTRCLHLKSACATLDDQTVLVNPAWITPDLLPGARTVSVPEEEPLAAEVLRVNGRLCMHDGFPRTRAMLESRGFDVFPVDLSEFIKAEAGPTCLSLLLS
jgi:dimethylargininase